MDIEAIVNTKEIQTIILATYPVIENSQPEQKISQKFWK